MSTCMLRSRSGTGASDSVRTMSRGRRLPLIAHAGSLRRKRRACRSAIAWSKYSRRSASWICGRSTCEEGGNQRPSVAIRGNQWQSEEICGRSTFSVAARKASSASLGILPTCEEGGNY